MFLTCLLRLGRACGTWLVRTASSGLFTSPNLIILDSIVYHGHAFSLLCVRQHFLFSPGLPIS